MDGFEWLQNIKNYRISMGKHVYDEREEYSLLQLYYKLKDNYNNVVDNFTYVGETLIKLCDEYLHENHIVTPNDLLLVSEELDSKATKSNLYYYNVRDYGAVGNAKYYYNGVYYADEGHTILAHDDTEAFNRALLASEQHLGGNNSNLKRVVYVPEGDYLISGTVYVRKGQHLKGGGIGSTRILIPNTEREEPTFCMGRNSEMVADSGGLPPTISDMSTEGGSLNSAIFDTGGTAGISLYNLFITAAGKGIVVRSGDLQAYNLTIDMCTIGIVLAESSRNVISNSSLFWNGCGIYVQGIIYDTIISNCNFSFSKTADMEIVSETSTIKNLGIKDCNFIANGQYETNMGSIVFESINNAEVNITDCNFTNQKNACINSYGTSTGNIINITDCVFDGIKTHTDYIQGTTSKAINVGNNIITVENSTFKGLKAEAITCNGSGKLTLKGCSWKNLNTSYFVNIFNKATTVVLINNVGDNVTPLINLLADANVQLTGNINWLGGTSVDGSNKVIKVPTFNNRADYIVKFSACTNPTGSALYRSSAIMVMTRYTQYVTDGVKSLVGTSYLYQTPQGTYDSQITLDVSLETTTAEKSKYILIKYPSNWSDVSIELI